VTALLSRRRDASTTKLVRLHLEQPVAEILIERPQRDALVIAVRNGVAVGQVSLKGRGVHTARLVRRALLDELGPAVARLTVAAETQRALSPPPGPTSEPEVSVIICTRRRPERLALCLDGLEALHRAPTEIVVVDNAPDDVRTAELCRQRPVRYRALADAPLSRLRNTALEAHSDLVAMIDDDCVAEPSWLDGLGHAFADPLVAAVIGYVGPAEFTHRAQRLFEVHGAFEMSFHQQIIDGANRSPAVAASPLGVGNVVFRRAALRAVGGFDERIGPGTPTRAKGDAELFFRLLLAGQRVLFDPARVVWHHHRISRGALREVLHNYALADTAYAAQCLLEHHQSDALRLWAWWWRTHLPGDLRRLLRRDPTALPLDCIAAEALGTLRGPAAFLAARRRHRGRPIPAPPHETAPSPSSASVKSAPPPASVVIPSHDRRERLIEVLDGLANQTARESIEVVVVLDGCRDRSAEAVRAVTWPFRLTLIEQRAAGVGEARNRGAREARHDLLIFLDDDLVPGPALVAEHAAAHARDPTGVTQGYHPPPATNTGPIAQILRGWWEDHFRRKAQTGRPWSFLDACAGNSAMSRALLFDAGGFDPAFRRSGDYELAIRLLASGVPWRYLPVARGVHHIDLDLAKQIAVSAAGGRGEVVIARKHPSVWPRLRISHLAGTGETSPSLQRAFAEPADVDRALARGIAHARRLERLGLRGRWLGLVSSLQSLAFARGVTQCVGTPAKLRELRAAGEAAGGDVPGRLVLGPGGGLDPLPSVGTASLVVWREGKPVTTVRAVDPGQQWDAEVVVARVAAAVSAAHGQGIAAGIIA
jgi:GT2 family glycosyltransferase